MIPAVSCTWQDLPFSHEIENKGDMTQEEEQALLRL